MKTSFIIFVLVFTVIMSVGIQVHAEDNFTPADQPQVSSPNEPQYSVDPNASTAPAKKAAPAPAAAQSVSDAGGTTSKIMDFLNRVLFAIAYFLGTLAMTLFSYVVLISSYNDFVTSEAVNKGWVLVRDMCNMFFVVILLIIAFAQILRVEKYSMKTLLPKVLIAAVLVNFSKLVCGLLIDFAQVIMMTFVNGYQATAGANLVVGLGFTKLLKMSAKSTTTSVDPGYSNADIFLTLAMGVVFLVLVIVVTFLILVLLTVRIVTLWILVVLSPFAFLLSDLPFGQSYATEWWKKFGEQVVIGPFLAFFLWLSLLIMSNPDQMITQDIRKAQEDITKSTGGAKQESMQLDNLAQFFIGLAMLLASFEMAQRMGGATAKWAGKVSGMSKSVGKKLGKFAGRTAYKVTGAKAVVKRGQAVYGGFMAKQKQKSEAKLKKWTERGEKVFAGKEAVVKKGKQAVRTGVEAVKIPKWFSQKGRDSMKARIGNAGMMETIAVDEIKQSHRDRKMKDADKFLAARGIKSPAQYKALIEDNGADKNLRRAAALKMAEKGMFDDKKDKDGNVMKDANGKPLMSAADYAAKAKDLLEGDRASSSAFGDALEKKQAHLALHLAGDDKGKQKVLAEKIMNGDIDIAKQHISADEDLNWNKFAKDTLGGRSYSDRMQQRIRSGGKKYKKAASGTMMEMAKDLPKNQTRVKNLESTWKSAISQNRPQDEIDAAKDAFLTAKDDFESLRTAIAGITGDASIAYGNDTEGLANYASSQNSAQINDTKLGENPATDKVMLQTWTVGQMASLANSSEYGATDKFKKISEQMVAMAATDDEMKSKVIGFLAREATRDSLEPKMKAQIEAMKKNIEDAKTNLEKQAKAEEERLERERQAANERQKQIDDETKRQQEELKRQEEERKAADAKRQKELDDFSSQFFSK